jgi:hypothetical protein
MSAYTEMTIVWRQGHDAEFPYRAEVDGRRLVIRINDFPAEPLYTLFVDGVADQDLEDWPQGWMLPSRPVN